jgi:hypothetical protein
MSDVAGLVVVDQEMMDKLNRMHFMLIEFFQINNVSPSFAGVAMQMLFATQCKGKMSYEEYREAMLQAAKFYECVWTQD